MTDINDIEKQLKKHGIRRTPFRVELLTLFTNTEHALSHQEITQQIGLKHDRVTVYRALDSFVERGLIHKVPDASGAVAKYALCAHDCSVRAHKDDHVHFICRNCAQTICLTDVEIPDINLPEGFIVENTSFTVHGTCTDCLKD